MTAQINDTVLYQGIWYALAAKRWHLTYYGVLARLPCALPGHRGRVAPVPHRAWSAGGAGPAGGVRAWPAAARSSLVSPRALPAAGVRSSMESCGAPSQTLLVGRDRRALE